MRRSIILPVLSAAALAANMSVASAFEVVTGDQTFRSDTLSTKLSDPEDIVQDMSRRYSGNSATIAHFGDTTIAIIGPHRSYGADSPFVPDPAAGTVPSKREW